MQNNITSIITPLEKFKHKSTFEIGQITGLNANLISKKTSISSLSNSMFSYTNINPTQLKKDFNLIIKTVCLKENGIPKESMSFERVQFHDVVSETWEHSFLKEKFTNTTLLFIIFQSVGTETYFKGFKVWKMPEETIHNELKSFWSLLKNKLENGITLKLVNQGNKTITKNDLPSTQDSKIMHIRPKASNAKDTVELPDGQLISKQAYWLNASYVGNILADVPALEINNNQLNQQILFKYDYQLIKPYLSKDIYTIDQFIKITQAIFKSFNHFDVNVQQIESVGYRLIPPFILHQNFNSLEEYFNMKIFKERYFKLPEDDVWQTSFSQRKLENMENNFSLFKIEDTIYLTETALKSVNIDKSTLISYRESVEEFVPKDQYFTLVSLKKSGFRHLIEEFGFESLFYESLLKRPGRLKSLKICGQLFFIKTPLRVDLSHFLTFLFKTTNQSALSVDKIIEQIHDTFGINLDFDAINNLLKHSSIDQYYSDTLCKLFLSKNDYLDFIH